MKLQSIYTQFFDFYNSNHKAFAILIDPDKCTSMHLDRIISICKTIKVDFIFVGGSLISENSLQEVVSRIKSNIDLPILLFPGASTHISNDADGILFLSLLSGRNADFLIGQQVLATPTLAKSNLEVISTAYLLIDGGKSTTVSYVSNTVPIPNDKPEIAAITALAGQYLGMKVVFLDAGSGATYPVSPKTIAMVKSNISLPLIVGGGIKSMAQVELAWQAGADIVVVGTAIENDTFNF